MQQFSPHSQYPAQRQPGLPPDLAKSKSVFFRKPGNESVVGSGTYGKVFKGLNVYTQKLVALKRIRMEGERDGFPVTAVREVKLLRSLKHINVVKLQEVMVEANECFMVFEYLSHDLTGLLNHPTFQADLGAKKDLAMQLFESLKYLHTRGVLHRDIKAANILVSSEGVLKLADFGLARFYEKNHQLDYTNRVITIWYRSPELLLGETRYGPAVDIWSAACVMHEIFTKTALFPGDGSEINQLERIYEVLGTPNKTEWPNLPEMPWFELLRPGYKKPNVLKEQYKDKLPGSAFELLASMLQYDPDKRPTATQVLQHPYFTSEEPAPRRATELKDIKGDWHEFESKALRREKERKEKERRAKEAADKQGIKDAAVRAVASGSTSKEASTHGDGGHEKDRKRPHEAADGNRRDAKRAHVEPRPPAAHRDQARERQRDKERDRDRAPASAAEVVTAGKAPATVDVGEPRFWRCRLLLSLKPSVREPSGRVLISRTSRDVCGTAARPPASMKAAEKTVDFFLAGVGFQPECTSVLACVVVSWLPEAPFSVEPDPEAAGIPEFLLDLPLISSPISAADFFWDFSSSDDRLDDIMVSKVPMATLGLRAPPLRLRRGLAEVSSSSDIA
ncbi:hypothetical protein P8C59_001286 [Phyllachora maydis]|uniref:cyclin-dependent kinase n=1 Tax=Phyllachora maydis TaxID=1825666 RepID=A0AAD9HZE3_9PEZI|nr:hypothetical protein P8C59_001286 [Phyllachora maydis]